MSQHEPADIATPGSIGPYRIVRELGRGGMGFVYEGMHQHLRRRVALKLLHPTLAADPTQVERFVREGRAACNIRHPHVIEIFEFGFAHSAPYLVMEFLDGPSLAQHLDQTGRLAVPDLLATLLPVISAVAAAHAAGIVHRDLKPGNVMLARDRAGALLPKVLDFGISKHLSPEELTLTNSFALIGTPHYMSPEQARSSRDVDARSDQYALGVMLYECATGARPFEGEGSYSLLHAIMTAPVIAPSSRVSGLPAGFDAVVARAMHRDPEQRYESVSALGAALLRFAPDALRQKWHAEFGAAQPVSAAKSGRVSTPTLRDAADTQRPRSQAWRWLGLALLTIAIALSAWATRSALTHPVAVENTAVPARATAAAQASSATLQATTPAATVAPLAPEAQPALAQPTNDQQPNAVHRSPAAQRSHPPPRGAHNRARSNPGSVTLGENGAPILE